MPTFIYNSALNNLARGNINFQSDTFWALMTTSSYVPDKDTHGFRSSVTNEVTGTNYTAGGKVIPVSVSAVDTANDRQEVTFGPIDWAALTATGLRQLVVYKRRGGASSLDELVYVHDFGADNAVTAATFTVEISTLRFQN